DGPNVTKEKARSLLKELKLPFALFHGGLWVEYIPFFLGYNFKEGVMNVVGEGDAKMSIVARSDLNRFIAHVLVEATKSSLESVPVAYILTRIPDGRCESGTVGEAQDTVPVS
ncbi:hypothetical protein JG688_00018033, partial [Phytophthora aleatoria]